MNPIDGNNRFDKTPGGLLSTPGVFVLVLAFAIVLVLAAWLRQRRFV